MFVVKHVTNNKYAAASGSKHSYTTSLEQARKFKTKNEAETDKCGNEYIISVDAILTNQI